MVAEKKLATALREAHRANGEAVFRLLRTGHGPHPDTFDARAQPRHRGLSLATPPDRTGVGVRPLAGRQEVRSVCPESRPPTAL